MCYSSIGDLLGGRRTEIHVWRLHDAACMAVERRVTVQQNLKLSGSNVTWTGDDGILLLDAAAVIISMSVCCLIHRDLTQIMGSTTA